MNLFSIPVYKGHLDQSFNIPDLWSGLSKGVWSGETGYTTAQVDLGLWHSVPEVEDLIGAMFPYVAKYWDEQLGYENAELKRENHDTYRLKEIVGPKHGNTLGGG